MYHMVLLVGMRVGIKLFSFSLPFPEFRMCGRKVCKLLVFLVCCGIIRPKTYEAVFFAILQNSFVALLFLRLDMESLSECC